MRRRGGCWSGVSHFVFNGLHAGNLTLDQETIQRLAGELQRAHESRIPIAQLSQRYPEMTIEDAYRISNAWVELKRRQGATVLGHKIGLTSRAMQQVAKINEPDYGALLDDMRFEQGTDIPVERFITPKLEIELAFVLARPLAGPGVTIFDVLSATEYVVPAIEIIDSRIDRVDPPTGATRTVRDTIADNAAGAGIIMGGRPVRPHDFDLRWVGGLLSRNGVIEETGLAAGVLNHPANGIAWLANKLGQWGEGLAAGEVLLAGSFTRPVDVARGDVFHADYGPLGSIACRFV